MRREEVYAWVDASRDRIVDLTSQLIKIPSRNPPGEYEAISRFVADTLEGIECEVDTIKSKPNKPNLVGRIKGTVGKPVLLYSVHMDTVPEGTGWTVPPFGGVVKDGKIYGRGALDAKGRMAVYLMAAKALKETGVKLGGDLVLAMTVDEETGGEDGAKYLVENGYLKGDMAICEWVQDSVLVGGTGYRLLRITTTGQHTRSKTVNAVEKMTKIVFELSKLQQKLKSRKSRIPDIGCTTIRVASIESSGVPVTWFEDEITPDRCSIDVQIVAIPEMDADDLVRRVQQMLNNLKKQDRDFKAKMKVLFGFDGWATPIKSSLPRSISKVAKEFGMKPKMTGIVGRAAASDGRFYLRAGMQMAQWGVGTPDCGFHKPDEFIRIDDLVLMTKVHAALMMEILGVG